MVNLCIVALLVWADCLFGCGFRLLVVVLNAVVFGVRCVLVFPFRYLCCVGLVGFLCGYCVLDLLVVLIGLVGLCEGMWWVSV